MTTQAATVKAFFPDLDAPAGFAPADARAVASVRVDARQLASALGTRQLDPASVACWAHDDDALVVVATLRDGLGAVSLHVPTVGDASDPF